MIQVLFVALVLYPLSPLWIEVIFDNCKELEKRLMDKTKEVEKKSLESNLSQIQEVDEKISNMIEELKDNIGDMASEMERDAEEQTKVITNLGQDLASFRVCIKISL